MSEIEKIESLGESLKKYVNTSFELYRLESIERASELGANIITTLLIVCVGAFFLLFISVTLGFYLSSRLDSYCAGFGIIACFYFLITLVLFFVRRKSLEVKFKDRIISKILK